MKTAPTKARTISIRVAHAMNRERVCTASSERVWRELGLELAGERIEMNDAAGSLITYTYRKPRLQPDDEENKENGEDCHGGVNDKQSDQLGQSQRRHQAQRLQLHVRVRPTQARVGA
eukprot:32847-Pleurochrysis_carterae.AAC.1